MAEMGSQLYVKLSTQEKKEKFDEVVLESGLKKQFVIEKAIDDFINKEGKVDWL